MTIPSSCISSWMRGMTAALLIAGNVGAHAAAPLRAPEPSPIVATTQGAVQGLIVDGIAAFKGIPYGAPPIAERRFLPPEPAPAWANVLVATDFGAPAMQMYDRPHTGADLSLQLATVFTTLAEMKIDNEDALFLNVWTPSTASGSNPSTASGSNPSTASGSDPANAARPVMVWLHGGGYAYGSGGWPVYDGANLARKGDVVVVTVNHRLNVFGYLYLAEALGAEYAASGNAGMLDLVLALEWVRDNIASFGGDPGNVTIMGESGGGSKVSHLMAMPAASGLFHKAIIQSGPGLEGVPAAAAADSTRAILTELGLAGQAPAEIRARLATLPADAILEAALAAQAKAGGGFGGLRLAPVVDGEVLPRHPFTPSAPEQSRDIPLLIGWNKDEMTIFNIGAPWFGTLTEADLAGRVEAVVGDKAEPLIAVYRRMYPDYSPTYLYNAILGDSRMFMGSVALAERQAAQGGAAVFMYYLTWETPVAGGALKSPHTLDMPLMFNNVDKAVALTGDGPEARKLEDQMSSSWIAFARNGDPNNPSVPTWPQYDAERRPAMVFDVTPTVVNDPNREARLVMAE